LGYIKGGFKKIEVDGRSNDKLPGTRGLELKERTKRGKEKKYEQKVGTVLVQGGDLRQLRKSLKIWVHKKKGNRRVWGMKEGTRKCKKRDL